MARSTNTIAKNLGGALAYLQDTIDVAVNWGFKKLKTTQFQESDQQAKGVTVAKKTANMAMGFLGELGESFFREYERLKRQRTSHSSSPPHDQ